MSGGQAAASVLGIVTDAGADVPGSEWSALVDAAGGRLLWRVVPERWQVGGAEVLDEGGSARELTRLVLSGRPPVPQGASVDDFASAYRELAAAGADHVLSVHASASFDDGVAAARRAAARVAAESGAPAAEVVETSGASLAVGLLAARAGALAGEGHPLEAVRAYVARHAARVHLLVVPDAFDPMAGRRIVAARLLAGRPMLGTSSPALASSGGVRPHGRLRSRRGTIQAIERFLAEHAPPDHTLRIALGHADAAGAVDPFLDVVDRLRPDATVELVGRLGPRVAAAVGARCVGMAWVVE